MFLFSYAACLCLLTGLALTVIAIRLGPRVPLNWAVAVTSGSYAVYSFSYIWVYGAADPATIWAFFTLSTLATTITFPSGMLADLLLAGWRPRRALLLWMPFQLFWIFMFVWPFFAPVLFSGFQPSVWGNTYVLAAGSSVFFGVGGVVLMIQKLLVWTLLWRARKTIELKRVRGLLTIFVPADIACVVILVVGQNLARWAGLPAIDDFLALLNVALLFFAMVRYQHLYPAARIEIARFPQAMRESVIVFDSGLRITDHNPAARDLFQNDSPNGLEFPALFEPSEAVRQEWSQAVATGQAVEVAGILVAGTEVELTLTPSFDKFGDLTGGLGIVRKNQLFAAMMARYGITHRERDVLVLLIQGYDRKRIADLRFIAEGTVKAHIHSIYNKTGAKNRVELMLLLASSK